MKVLVTTRITAQEVEQIRSIGPDLQVVREVEPERAREQLKDAEILCGYQLPGPLEEARALKWIQLVSAGANHLLDAGVGATDILVTTASGIHGHAVAEYALGAMIMLARRIPLVLQEMGQRQWRPSRQRTYYGGELYGKTLGILGMGAIGQQVASSARCLGMRVLGLRRSGGDSSGDVAEEVFPPEGLMQMLPHCDFVLVLLPLTRETSNLIGERELRAMKPSAYFINVARGEIVDEVALARALKEGWIAGAALDVFAREPLPPDSNLWDLPNVVLTPHMAGNTLPYLDRAMELFRDNLRRYLAGEPMVNVLDKARGY